MDEEGGQMGQSVQEWGRGRGWRPIRSGPPGFPCRKRDAILRECTPEQVVGPTFNLLTESPTIEEEASRPYLIPRPGITAGDNGDAAMEDVRVSVPAPTQKKRGRGPAICTEFEKLRKHGLIHLKINDGEMAPCCSNAGMFTTRITWILKHHAHMSHARWTDVPKPEKDELMERIRGDFELDWEKHNHQMAVWKALRKRFNAYHHELHKKYMKFATHEEALASETSMVNPIVWTKLCERWGSDSFKKMSARNKESRKKLDVNHTSGCKSFVRVLEEKRVHETNVVDFYRHTRWSKKKEKFVTPATEHNYNKMTSKMDALEPEKRTDEAASEIFRSVLGQRAGYARGLGEMVIPDSRRVHDRIRDKEYAELVERHKKDAQTHKDELEAVREDMRKMMERQLESEKKMMEKQRQTEKLLMSLMSER
ncbi:uncharacterized protein LOC122307477 [Carya illinoinensis]|uniref:uncharacterized protein LOC122307477 n=1 Tax=Carya illinoinensis TaxID=32201 RepID=UPI001C729349|nr:uncharacterized protein LOC122307477 [Carya illinoinensis]